MYRLTNTIMPYAWGSHDAIAELQGRARSKTPEAELWMGAHPRAPSVMVTGGRRTRLDEAIASDPEVWLGAKQAARSCQLPFLFKVLSAATPLSLQAHPSAEQALAGFEKEERLGVPIDASHRNYKDRNHKPELICALGEFHALCGFKPVREICRMFDALGIRRQGPGPSLGAALESLREAAGEDQFRASAALRETFRRLLVAPPLLQRRWTSELVAACETAQSVEYGSAFSWARELNRLYPGDVGVVLSLMLNLVALADGEAMFLSAGVLHAYLRGTGIELMANSDNVLRGGLTPKHVDVQELLHVLNFTSRPPDKVKPTEVAPGVLRYPTSAAEFELFKVRVEGAGRELSSSGSTEIVLVSEGELMLRVGDIRLALRRGESAVVAARPGPLQLLGRGVLYRASVPV